MAEGRDRWRAVVNAVMNPRFPQNARKFLSSLGHVSFSETTLPYGVRRILGVHKKCLQNFS
jgi:hypothetical protein